MTLTPDLLPCREALDPVALKAARRAFHEWKGIEGEKNNDRLTHALEAYEAARTRPPAGEQEMPLHPPSQVLVELSALAERLCKLGNEPHDGNSVGNDIAKEIRALLPSLAVLDRRKGE